MIHSRRYRDVLFADGDLFEGLRERVNQMLAEVDRLPEERRVGTPVEDLVGYFLDKFGSEMVVLDPNGIAVAEHGKVPITRHDYGVDFESQVHEVRVAVPFTGDPDLFRYQGSVWTSIHERTPSAFAHMDEEGGGSMLFARRSWPAFGMVTTALPWG